MVDTDVRMSKLNSRMVFATLVTLACAIGGVARAAPNGVVIEAYDGPRPQDTDGVLAPVYAELGQRGFDSGPKLIAAVNERVSREPGTLSASQLLDAQKKADDAYQQFIDGDYTRALASARAALALYDLGPGQLAREPALRDGRYKALVVAARSSELKGSAPDAFGYMAEVIRSFRDRPVNTAQFDPSVIALYRRVREELERQGTGTLEIKVDDPAATVFVDEVFAGTGGSKLGGVAPGRHRVYVVKGQAPGRIHEIDVPPKGSASLEVSWEADSALRTSGPAVAVDLPAGTNGEADLQPASQLGRALGAKTVVVLSLRKINGRRAIAGYSISVESQTRVFAAVQIEPIAPSADTLAQLARLLAGDKSAESSGLITTEPTGPALTGLDGESTIRDEGPRWYDDRIAWLITGAGVVIGGAGIYEAAHGSSLDDQAAQQSLQSERQRLQNDASSARKIGGGLLIAGGAVLAVGIVKLVLVPSEPHNAVTARASVSVDIGLSWVGLNVRF